MTRKAKTLEVFFVTICSAAFGAFFTYPLLQHLSTIGPGVDRDSFTEGVWAAAYTVGKFHQVPFWDPFKCGGLPLLADPQSRMFTPFFLLHLGFGPLVGTNLELTFHLAIAWAGGYILGRLLGLSYLPAAVCATVFPSSSWIYLHFSSGHITFISTLYLPLIVSLWLLSIERRRIMPIAGAGLVMGVVYGEGGFYALSFAAPMLATVALIIAVQRRQFWPVLAWPAIGAFGAGFAAVKFLPTLALHISRGTDSTEIETLRMLGTELFSRNQDLYRWLDGMHWGFYEYGAYLGPFFALLAILGICFDLKRALPWFVGALVVFVLALGSPVWWAPWALLHQLPLFDYEHVPSRFLLIFVMAMAPLAGMGAQALCRRGWICTAIVALILIAATRDCWNVNHMNVRHGMAGLVREPAAWNSDFRQFWDDTNHQTYFVATSNRGALNCNSMNILGLHAVGYNQPDYRGEQYLLGDGSVKLTGWTPNELTFDVQTPSTVIMVINQNYEPGWRLVKGRGDVFSRSGLLGIILPAGHQHLELAYQSVAFERGLTITLVTFLLTSAIWFYERRRDRNARSAQAADGANASAGHDNPHDSSIPVEDGGSGETNSA